MTPKTVLAIDPGSSKCGLALVERDSAGHIKLIERAIVPKESLVEKVSSFPHVALTIVGSGTRSRETVDALREAMPSMGILIVDERDTSLQARERYWEHHPRRGWRRLLPATMQVPPEPVDDFVALILAERVLLEN